MLLGAASQRIEFLLIEWFGTDWLKEILMEWKRKERGSFPGLVESAAMIYVASMYRYLLGIICKMLKVQHKTLLKSVISNQQVVYKPLLILCFSVKQAGKNV